MNKIEGIKHLLSAVPDINKASNYFREYLNSGSKEYWDQYVIASTFTINLCQICDKELLEKKDCETIESCIYAYNEVFNYNDYTPDKKQEQEKVLEILWKLKNIIYPLTIKVLKEINNKEIVNQECYVLLKNLK